jgi:shikimate dehydrogenase
MKEHDLRRAGVAGWPISHSRSPLIHRYWLAELGIAGGYERFAVPPEEFAQFAEGIGREGLVGSNVTTPHKEAAFAVCDRRTAVAQALGAVNTLWRDGELLWGDNTDVEGFLANMDEGAPGWTAKTDTAVVFGAGGAARAIVYALVSRGFRRIAIINRTEARAAVLAAEFGPAAVAVAWSSAPLCLSTADLVVNASALGMSGRAPLDLDVSQLPERAVVADIVYVPLHTPLVEAARARGLRATEGIGMLLHQAAPAFARWFGPRPKVTRALRALLEADVRTAHGDMR